jgi:hypothetical protein
MTGAVVDTNKPVPIALDKFPDGFIWFSVFTGGKKPFCESTTYDADTLPGCNLFPCFRAASAAKSSPPMPLKRERCVSVSFFCISLSFSLFLFQPVLRGAANICGCSFSFLFHFLFLIFSCYWGSIREIVVHQQSPPHKRPIR